MIKVKDGVASREPLPDFLYGLMPESLVDLSWTDPALGVQGSAWWPEEDTPVELEPDMKWFGESFVLDEERKVVIVTKLQVPLAIEELADRHEIQSAQDVIERDRLLTLAAFRMIPYQDAIDVDDATDYEIGMLKKWKQYRVALNRLKLPVASWPSLPE